jgi:hypothetical protein
VGKIGTGGTGTKRGNLCCHPRCSFMLPDQEEIGSRV